MQILAYEQFINHPANKTHQKYVYIDLYTEYVTLHTGLALIPISDAISQMVTEGYDFLCPMLDDLVIDHLRCHHVWAQPDHDPSVLYNWIQKSLNLPKLNFNTNDTLTTLIRENPPLEDYLNAHDLPTPLNPTMVGSMQTQPSIRLGLLKHIKSLGVHNIEFEFLFITKE